MNGDVNSINVEDPIIIDFDGSSTSSTRVWKIAIIKKGKSLKSSNVCDNCWKRVCNSKTCSDKLAYGTVVFRPEDIGGIGEYNAYLTTNSYSKRAGPLSFTVTAAPTGPTLTPAPSQSPIASSNKACNPNKANNCIEANLESDGNVRVSFANSPKTKWKIVLIRAGQPVKTQNIIQCSGVRMEQRLGRNNGSKDFDIKQCGLTQFDVYTTTNAYSPRIGPVRVKVNQPTEAPTPTPCNSDGEIKRIQQENSGTSLSRSSTQYENLTLEYSTSSASSTPYDDYGCFYHDEDENTYISEQLSGEGGSMDARAEECNDICDTKHFAITDKMCFCYVKAPATRLTIGSCASITETCLGRDKMMDAFLKGVVTEECNQENTVAVRNFFVEEDDAPFGYDITSNSFRLSPFELEKDECGTNIYEVQTEVSEGTNTLSTNSKEVSEFASERRLHISNSVSVSASVSAWIPFIVNGGASVMASLDTEVNSIMKYSGSTTIGSKVFTSFGVKRIAEIKLVDFDNRFSFVTFNTQFANLLRKYRDSGYSLEVAEEIFEKYGMFVVERGLFGGYRQLRSTVTSQDIETFSSSENDFRLCYELAMSVNAKKYFGLVEGEASSEIAGCTELAQKNMNRRQEQFSQEVTSENIQGGTIIDLDGKKSFIVSPQDSTLLTDLDKYPEGDDGIKLRILSDFLLPDKVSPLEVKRHLITEKQFEEIRNRLDAHIVEVLQKQLDTLDGCPKSTQCTVPYLEDDEKCACYAPKEPEPLAICSKDGVFQPDENQFYTIQRGDEKGPYWKEESGLVLSESNSKNNARSHWKFKKTGVSNNWFLSNGYNGKNISSLDSSHRLKTGSNGMEVRVICQDDGTIRISDASGSQSRFEATVTTFSKSTSCRYPTYLDSCEEEFDNTYKTQTAYKKCGPADGKRYKVCSQFSLTFPLRGTFKKTSRCDFPNFLESCSGAFGSGWYEVGKQKCGAIKIRRKCEFKSTDKSSTFFVSPVS